MESHDLHDPLKNLEASIKNHYFRTMLAVIMTKMVTESEAVTVFHDTTLPIFEAALSEEANSGEEVTQYMEALQTISESISIDLHLMYQTDNTMPDFH